MDERPNEREAIEIQPGSSQPVGPGIDATLPTTFDPTRLDFGHYLGYTLEDLAVRDPEYLRWLERHPSGVRYRQEIHRVLGEVPSSINWRR